MTYSVIHSFATRSVLRAPFSRVQKMKPQSGVLRFHGNRHGFQRTTSTHLIRQPGNSRYSVFQLE